MRAPTRSATQPEAGAITMLSAVIGMKVAPFVLPLAVALFAFILISNWLAVFPWQYGGSDGAAAELYKPPASDINFVLALALFVFICYHAAGIWRRGAQDDPFRLVGQVKPGERRHPPQRFGNAEMAVVHLGRPAEGIVDHQRERQQRHRRE